MSNRSMIALALAAALVAVPLEAQGRGRNTNGVPPGHRPPAGMCRIWIDGVPPGQQPAPTSCAEAVRNRPANGRVIFGSDDDRRGSGGDDRDGRRGRGSDDVDDRRRDRPNTCVDANRDGRCDGVSIDRPRGGWPEMIGAVAIERGQRTADVSRWLGTSPMTARYLDADKNGVPERATWRNSRGQVVQVWTDTNGDGRADRVDYYEGGKIARTVKP